MPTLALPLAIGPAGGLAALEQGTDVELAQSVSLLLATRPGERQAVPGYGLPDQLGAGVTLTDIVAAIGEWEERALPAAAEQIAGDLVTQVVRTYITATQTSAADPDDVESEGWD